MSTLSPSWQLALCTWFGAGRLRPAPGTLGSLAAALLGAALLAAAGPQHGRWLLLVLLLAVVVAALLALPAVTARLGVADPPEVVVDEVAGVWLALAVLPAQLLAEPLLAAGAAFLLFRVFDIAKPWPVSWCEHLPGGWGIMLDDLAAGLIAGGLATAALG